MNGGTSAEQRLLGDRLQITASSVVREARIDRDQRLVRLSAGKPRQIMLVEHAAEHVVSVQPPAVPKDQQHARPANLFAGMQAEPRQRHSRLGLQLRARAREFGLPVAGPSEADQNAAALGALDVEKRQLIVAGEIAASRIARRRMRTPARLIETHRPSLLQAQWRRRPNRRDRTEIPSPASSTFK